MSKKINDGLTKDQRYYRRKKSLNPNHGVECQRDFRKRNPEKSKQNCREYYAKNRERELLRKKESFQKFKSAGYSDRRRLMQRVNQRYRHMATKCDNTLTISEWIQILEHSDFQCQKCGTYEDLTMDHIIPISKGGLHTKANIGVLCRKCNSSKGNKL